MGINSGFKGLNCYRHVAYTQQQGGTEQILETNTNTDVSHDKCRSNDRSVGRITVISITYIVILTYLFSGFCSLKVACWPLVPKFAGSHPAEAVGFLG